MRACELKQSKRGERGSVMAVSAFGMLAFLLAVGLCVDFSHFYVVKAELQNAADAASLAGASALNSSQSGITLATERAVEVMNNCEFNHQGVAVEAEDVQFAVNFEGPYMGAAQALAAAAEIRFVRVVIPPKEVGVSFSSVAIGSDTVNLTQNATAGMSVPPNVHCDWIPLTVIDDDANPFREGQTYTIRSGPQNSVSPGNYQILAVAGRGGSDAREGIARGVDDCAEPGSIYEKDTKPGVSSGPVREGINTRFDEYHSGMGPEEFPPDVNIKENINWSQYKQALAEGARNSSNFAPPNPAHHGVPLRRVVLIPLVKWSEFDNGRDTVKFYKFAAFFLQAKVGNGNGGDIKAEYIGERFVFGRGGYKPGGGPVNPQLAQPVLYR